MIPVILNWNFKIHFLGNLLFKRPWI